MMTAHDELQRAIGAYILTEYGQGFRLKDFVLCIDMIDLDDDENRSTTTYAINPTMGAPATIGLLEITKQRHMEVLSEN
jgi:hypothetical protein